MDTLDEHVRLGLEKIDADSWDDWCRKVPADVAQTLKLSVKRRASVVISRCIVSDSPMSNRVMGLGMEEACTLEMIDDVKRHFGAHDLKNFALQISPYARMKDNMPIDQMMAQAGLVVRARNLKLLRGSAPADPVKTSCRVRKLEADEAALFGDVSARGWGRPPIVGQWMGAAVGYPGWHHYLAYAGDQPAAAAAMYVDGKFAWLGIGSTLAEYRNQGAQSALIAQRITDALALGCEHLVAETEKVNASSQNLMRAGFKLVYERPNYGIPVPGN